MHEVTVTTTIAYILLILTASGFSKVRHWREVNNDGTPCIEPSIEIAKGIGSVLLLSKLNIHVTNHVVGQIVTDVQALDFAVLAELLEQILVKVLEVVLDLAGVEGLALGVDARSHHVGALVHV